MQESTLSRPYPGDVTIQAPFEADVWDMTVIHNGRAARVRFTERGWQYAKEDASFSLQAQMEKALAYPTS